MMKSLIIAAALLLTASLTQAQDVTVDTEKKLNIDFSKYKTYTWASQVDNKLDPGFYFLNDLELKQRIRDAVKSNWKDGATNYSDGLPI